MNSIGQILREERLRQGRDLGAIADSLCVTKRYLDAIERDDIKSLPGVFFFRSFVKQYAQILGIDEATLAEPMAMLLPPPEEVAPPPSKKTMYALDPSPAKLHDPRAGDAIIFESNRRMLADRRVAIPAVALLIVLVGGGIVYERWSVKAEPNAASIAAPVPAPEPPKPAPETGAGAPVLKAADPKPTDDAPAPVQAAGFVPVSSATPLDKVEINVAATEKVWISITSDGKQIFSGVLQPSQSKTLSGHEFAKVRVGNAGGLEIRWNGKSIGPIGPRGKVRILRFTKDAYEILPPANGETL